ncbi:rod shape-determining protein MreD [Lacticigenium naphthae]|uniref:rod shape-determining protein MreD n=1 Tax=Lacticigenium naphthae TaxID=515351 RepID=UPI000415AE6B|nr:rod shape-determining protein MreD [Lacticigenium naphthae]
MKSKTSPFILPSLILFGLLLTDGFLSIVIKSFFPDDLKMMVPRMMLMGLIFFSFHLDFKKLIMLTFLIGFVYDSYYSGILGIYMFFLVLLVNMVFHFKNFFNRNFWTIGLFQILFITVFEFMVYGIYYMIDFTSFTLIDFLAIRLGYTLLLNVMMFPTIYFPLNHLMKKTVNSK